MCLCLSMYVCVRLHFQALVCGFMCVSVHSYVCVCLCACVFVCEGMCVWMCVCVCLCVDYVGTILLKCITEESDAYSTELERGCEGTLVGLFKHSFGMRASKHLHHQLRALVRFNRPPHQTSSPQMRSFFSLGSPEIRLLL